MLRNVHNWRSLYRAARVFSNPMRLAGGVLRRRAPSHLRLHTPTGPLLLRTRNFESLKTAFSVFCREDYGVAGDRPLHFLDVGANIGISATYFLTRHPANTVTCYEPDVGNLECLRENLLQFGGRARIEPRAVGVTRGSVMLYRADDGKYSSTIAFGAAIARQSVAADAFADVLSETRGVEHPTVIKLDVEGVERDLIGAIDFANFPNVERLFCESTDCGELIHRRHLRTVRNGYVEDLRFLPA
jgi:FkbM family methyltransferase